MAREILAAFRAEDRPAGEVIDDYLARVTDLGWVLAECCSRVPDDAEPTRLLLEFGVKRATRALDLLAMRRRHSCQWTALGRLVIAARVSVPRQPSGGARKSRDSPRYARPSPSPAFAMSSPASSFNQNRLPYTRCWGDAWHEHQVYRVLERTYDKIFTHRFD